MGINMFKTAIIAAGLVAFAGAANAGVLYTQAYDGSANLYASQNDTTSGGFGNFATTYDDFTLSQTSNLNGVDFVGGYFNPGSPGNITAFTLTFYNDAAGIPGGAIATGVFSGNGAESNIAGDINSYSLAFLNFQVGPGTYWVSVVPDQAFPPQWGTATSGTGTGNAYQCFFGSCGTIGGVNMAFSILGDPAGVPEPASWALMMVGFGGIGSLLRARRRQQAVAAV